MSKPATSHFLNATAATGGACENPKTVKVACSPGMDQARLPIFRCVELPFESRKAA